MIACLIGANPAFFAFSTSGPHEMLAISSYFHVTLLQCNQSICAARSYYSQNESQSSVTKFPRESPIFATPMGNHENPRIFPWDFPKGWRNAWDSRGRIFVRETPRVCSLRVWIFLWMNENENANVYRAIKNHQEASLVYCTNRTKKVNGKTKRKPLAVKSPRRQSDGRMGSMVGRISAKKEFWISPIKNSSSKYSSYTTESDVHQEEKKSPGFTVPVIRWS